MEKRKMKENQFTSLLIDFYRTRPFEWFEEREFVGIAGVGDDDFDFAFFVVNSFDGHSWIAKAFCVEVNRQL